MCVCIFSPLQIQLKVPLFHSREILSGVVRKLRKCAKEGQLIFETSVTKHGLEHASSKTPQSFSTADGAHWCKQLYSAYRADLEIKEESLQDLEYNTTKLAEVISTWERSSKEAQGVYIIEHY